MLLLTVNGYDHSIFLWHRPRRKPLPYIDSYVLKHIQMIVNHFQDPFEIHRHSLHRSGYAAFLWCYKLYVNLTNSKQNSKKFFKTVKICMQDRPDDIVKFRDTKLFTYKFEKNFFFQTVTQQVSRHSETWVGTNRHSIWTSL